MSHPRNRLFAVSLFVFFAVAETVPTASKHAAPIRFSEGYPFRDAYPLRQSGAWGHRSHSLLTTPEARVRNGERFDVSIRLYNDGGESEYYNTHWDRLIALPGRLALYDAHKHYASDLLEFVAGSRSTAGPNDWGPVLGHVDTTLSVVVPWPRPDWLPPGTYYLQVIYLPRAVELPSKVQFFDRKELFRSNAIKITVVD